MELFTKFFSWVLNLLPKSPFRSFINAASTIPYLAELNWFLPISEIIVVLEAWIAVVAVFYLYSAIMRFIRIIQ